jgi:hypothetical protein
MGCEFIGECSASEEGTEFENYEEELAIKYIKRECRHPPRGVDVQVTSEGYEIGNEGDEVSYPLSQSFGTTPSRTTPASSSGSA